MTAAKGDTLRPSASSCCDSSSRLLSAMMFILKARAILAADWPMSPYPTTPNVLPLQSSQRHALVYRPRNDFFLK